MSPARALPFKCSAVISDVDGTLVTDDKVLTRTRPGGCGGTARQRYHFFDYQQPAAPWPAHAARAARNQTAVGGFNGGVIATPDLAVVTEHLLPPRLARRAVDTLNARGVEVWVFSGQDWLLRDPDGPYVPLEQLTVGFRPTVVEDFGSALDAAAKIVGVSKDFGLLEQCERDVRAALADGACVARSQSYYLDITHPLANKGVALTEIAKLLGVPLAEVAAIGDGANDVAMFERSGLSIAMGNAKPEVRQAADFVTDSNGDDGFAKAIERFILGGGRSRARAEPAKAGDRTW